MIIITGASGGIGGYLFKKFTNEGHEVLGTFFSTKMENDLNKSVFFKVDVSDYKSVEKFIDENLYRLNDLSLINCAGISYNSFAHKSDVELWHKVIDVNLKGTFNVIHALLPLMRQQGYGKIINFSSVVTKLPVPGISAYSASKSGVNGLTKSLAIENGSKGITVNAINLGYTNVGMGVESVPIDFQNKLLSQIPVGRFCEPIEIYNTVLYILNNSYLNGSVIDLNGGLI